MDWCLIKGKSIIDSSAKTHVIATILKVNPVDNLDNSIIRQKCWMLVQEF